MNDKSIQAGGITGKGMGFVKNAGNEDLGHVARLSPDKFSAVFHATASAVAVHTSPRAKRPAVVEAPMGAKTGGGRHQTMRPKVHFFRE
jgi:hypothetical protein